MKRVTLYDVADAVGFSPATVSLALNDKGNVPQERREMIKRVAKEMGYVPNISALGLSRAKIKHVGLIVNYVHNAMYRGFVRGLESALDSIGYTYSIFQSADSMEKQEKYLSILTQMNVDGIILMPINKDKGKKIAEIVKDYNIPVVTVINRLQELSAVQADNFTGGALMAEHALSMGCGNNLYITAKAARSAMEDRMKGFLSVMSGHGFTKNNIIWTDGTVANEGYRAMAKIAGKYKFPLCVTAMSDETASGVIRYCREHGIRIPEDVSVIGFANNYIIDEYGMDLTSVDIPIEDMAKAAVDLIIKGAGAGRQLITLPVHLVARGSTKK